MTLIPDTDTPPIPKETLYIFADVSGPWDFKSNAIAINQPHLVRFAAIWENDHKLVRGEHCWIVKPDGWHITAVNGSILPPVSGSDAQALGRPMNAVLDDMAGLFAGVERVVAHNRDWYAKLMESAYFRARPRRLSPLSGEVKCTMRSATNKVKAPKMSPGGGYKWPTLMEAADWANAPVRPTGDPIDDALQAVRAVRAIWHAVENVQTHSG